MARYPPSWPGIHRRGSVDFIQGDDRNEESDNSDNKYSDGEDIIFENLDKSSSEEIDPYEEAPRQLGVLAREYWILETCIYVVKKVSLINEL